MQFTAEHYYRYARERILEARVSMRERAIRTGVFLWTSKKK